MGKFNCINRKSKEFKDLKSNLSKALGLTDITVTDETLLDVIDLFAADNDITEVEALDRMEELSKYIEDYFGFNTKYTPDSDLQEQYDEWFNDNIDYINTPYIPTEETNEFEENAKVITEEKAKVINLSNGQRMVVIPNSPLPAIAKEIQNIKEKAIANGTFMKAPNGQPTNLTEQQWLQVRTKAFKNWFGDWENNPENASKVVDENGEPRVMYHGTGEVFNTFDLKYFGQTDYGDRGVGFYFAYTERNAKSYGSILMPVFLNIREPFNGTDSFDAYINRGRTKEEVIKDASEYILEAAERGIKWMIEQRNTGETSVYFDEHFTLNSTDEEIRNTIISEAKEEIKLLPEKLGNLDTTDGYKKYDYEVVVVKPNQIKSATDNIGTFSTLSDNIYYNLSSKSITKDLKDKGLIHAYNGELYVTKKGVESLEDIENYFIEKMMRLGYSEDSYDLDRTTNGVRVVINEGSRKADYIESEVNHTFSTIENTIKFLEEKIPALKGKVHYNITIKEAKEILGNNYSDSVNSFVHNGEIYLIRGRVTQDIAIEEALHILTESLIIDNKALAYELLHEAEKLFPQLVDEIRRTYEGADTQNREILTQALARVFRQEFNEGERQTAESILSKFINWIKQLFGINPTTGNTIIELDELSTDMTLRDFAQLINSSNAEFKTWSHNKTQFNKSVKGELISSSAKSSAFARQLTLADRIAEIEEMIQSFNATVIKSKNFAEDHTYYIKTDKGSKKVDISVTSLNAELLGEKFENPKDITYPQGHIGNSFDALVRDYFNGGITTQVYPNFSNSVVTKITKQLDEFVKQLDTQFGKGKYQVITKDWSLGGYVTVSGKKVSVAGSIDMMVVTESGDIYIYDMKTTSKDISESIDKYTGQLTFYKELIAINYPEIAKRIKGVGLLVCDINFGKQYGSTNYKSYSIKKGTKDQLLFNKVEIQRQAGHINPVIQTTNTSIGGFILDLQASQVVEDLEKHPLKMQKVETEEDFVVKETQKSLFEKGGKKLETKKEDVDKLGTVKEVVNTDADLCPVPDVEITYLGNAIIKLLSKYLDELNDNDAARIKYLSKKGKNLYAENFFVKSDRDKILTSDVFHALLNYIRKTHFNPFDDRTVVPGSELQQKLIWINKNFNAIVNSGFSTLISLENVALTMSKDTTSEYANQEISRALLKEEREESQQMAFDVDSKEKSYMDSIPAQLKTRLSKIYKRTYDADGNPTGYRYDDYDYLLPTFEDKHYVVNTIMSLVHGCTNVDTMIQILRDNNSIYPWLRSVVVMLEESQMLRTQFFRTFRKNATLYNKLYMVKEYDKNGHVTKIYYRSEPLTIKGKIDKIVGALNVTIEANESPLFDKVRTGVVSINEDKFDKFKENVKKLTKSKSPSAENIRILRRVLRSLGVNNIDNLSVLKESKYRELYSNLVKSLEVLKATLVTLDKKGEPFIYNSKLNKSFYFIAQSLTVTMDDEYEISVYDGGKSRMTYTEPTALQTLIETLSNVNPDFTFEDAIKQKYGKYSQFVNDNGFISSWLTELSEDTELQSWIKHVVRTTFDETTYLEQNDAQYILSLMLDYAAPRIKNSPHSVGTDLSLAFFRVPIMSDKNSSESILFKTYALDYNDTEKSLAETKAIIADKMHQFFLQEIKRMRSIYQQLWNDENSDVEFYHLKRDAEAEALKAKGKTKDGYGKLTVKEFLSLRNQRGFNGFKFHYTPMFNEAVMKDPKLAQMIVDIINGKTVTGLRAKYDEHFVKGVDSKFESWKANVEKTIPDLAKQLAASLDFIRTTPNKKTAKLGELTDYDAFLQEYYWNDYLATCNIYNLTIIDPAFNKDVTDLQKRFAQVHSATIKCDTTATFNDEFGREKKFSDGTFRFIILEDTVKNTDLKKEIKKIFIDAAEKAAKANNEKKAKELRMLAAVIPSKFDGIKFTDGQGYSSPTGFWKKLSMLGEYNDELTGYVHTLKDSLSKIEKGDFSLANFDMVIQAFKPFVFGHSPHVSTNTVMGEYLIPTQIKDSEAMLVLAGAILRSSESSSPLSAIFEFMENSHWKLEDGKMTYQDDGIDTIVFHSAVKQGAYGVVNINKAKTKEEIVELLEKATIHELPYDSWGKQTEVPEHLQDHMQGMGSQQKVLSVSDIADDAIITVNGKSYNKKNFLKRYFTLLSEDMKEGIQYVEDLLELKGDRLTRNKKLSELLVQAVVKDAKYTDTLRKAFTLNAAGEFNIPLGDPTIADKFFSVLFSLVKNKVNLQKFPGGPTVQMSVYGMDEELNLKYKDEEHKIGLYCEAMITCPTSNLERRLTVTTKNLKKIKSKFGAKYKVGDMLDVDDAIALEFMTEGEAWFIFDRIPTEDKYSIWPCRVKRFLPRQMGEFVILPKETLQASGYDLDIDKGFISFKFSNPKTASQKRKNEIFEMQLASLLHTGTLEKSFNPGSFDDLKDLAKQVDPNFGSNDMSLMFLDGQYYYRHNNAAGKQYVGIAALNNTCHGLCNMAGVGFKSMVEFKINGISSLSTYDETTEEYKFDTVDSIYDGTRISRTLGMFVGAAADNAKDAVLASVGCTPTTGTFVNGLIRMGIPLDIVVYMMTNPTVKELISKAELSDERLEVVIAEAVNDPMDVIIQTLGKTNFTAKQLLDRISTGKNEAIDKTVLYFLKAMTPYVLAIADTNTIMSLNSTKNSVGPDVYNTIKRELDIEDVFDRIEDGISVLGESCTKENLIKQLPFIGELIYCFDTLIPKIAMEHSPLYQGEFKAILKKLKKLGFWVDDKFIKQTYNAYLIYRATALGVIDGTYQGRKATIFETPLHVFKDKQVVENAFLSYLNVKKRMNKKTEIPTVAGVNTGLSTESRDMLSANWTALSKDVRTKKLSDLIIEHFLYKFGFMFNPSSPLTMLSTYNKLYFKNGEYASIFKERIEGKKVNIDINDFIIQYARNNPYSKLWEPINTETFNEVVVKDEKGKRIKVDSEKFIKEEEKVGIRFGYRLFIYEKSVGTTDIYKEVTSLGIEKNFLEYNGAAEGVEMKTVITKENKDHYNSMYNVLISEDSVDEVEDFEVETPEGEDGEFRDKITKPSIYEREDLQELLEIKEYKPYESRIAKREEGILKELWEKLRRDKENKTEYQELLKALKEVC